MSHTPNLPLAPTEHTPATLKQLFHRIRLALSGCADDLASPIGVCGTLGQINEGNQPVLFDLALRDGDDEILLKIRRDLLRDADLCGGERVRLIGGIVGEINRFTEHRLLLRLDASKISKVDEGVQSPDDESLIECLRSLPMSRRQLPRHEPLRIVVIHSRSGYVVQEFENQLSDIKPLPIVSRISVNMWEAAVVASRIREADGDVVAVIRGGGDGREFAVFDSPVVLRALSASPAYRVTGLGHNHNRTLLDFVADYAADTPTAAGTHIASEIRAQRGVEARARNANERYRALELARDQFQRESGQLRSIIASFRAPSGSGVPGKVWVKKLAWAVCAGFITGLLTGVWLTGHRPASDATAQKDMSPPSTSRPLSRPRR